MSQSENKIRERLEENKKVLMDLLMQFSMMDIPDLNEINKQRKIIDELENALMIEKSSDPCKINNMGITSLIEMRKIMEEASESELFVFDYDETLATNRYLFWGSGLIKYDKELKFNEYIPFLGFEDVMSLIRSCDIMILTARGSYGITDADNFMKKYGFKVSIIGTARQISKGEMMLHILSASPKYKIVHFMDDCEKNIKSVEECIAENCTGLTLYTYQAPPITHEKCDLNLTQEEKDARIKEYRERSIELFY